MKKLLALGLVAAPLTAFADPLPSLTTTGGAMVLPEGKFNLNYRQLHFKRDTMFDGSKKVTNRQNLNAKANVSMLSLAYGWNSQTTFSVMMPYKNLKADASLAGNAVKIRNSGIGDIWLNARRSVFGSPDFKLAIDGGIKFPTGDSSKGFKKAPPFAMGVNTPLPTQPGTDGYEFKLGLGATKIFDETLRVDSNMHYIYRPKARHDYDFGNEFAFTIGAVKALDKKLNVGLDYSFTYNSKTNMGEDTNAPLRANLPFKAFSGSAGYITPSIQIVPFGKPKFYINAGVSMLVHYDLKEYQPLEKERYMLNIGYMF